MKHFGTTDAWDSVEIIEFHKSMFVVLAEHEVARLLADAHLVSKLAPEFKATNPVDHIYALRGITQSEFPVDYSKPVKEVYCNFAWYLMQKYRVAQVLRDAQILPPFSFTGEFTQILEKAGIGWELTDEIGLLTWIPNFPAMSQMGKDKIKGFSTPLFHAAEGLGKDDPDKKTFVEGDKLVAYGLRASSISKIWALNGPYIGSAGKLSSEFSNLCCDFVHRVKSSRTRVHPLLLIFKVLYLGKEPDAVGFAIFSSLFEQTNDTEIFMAFAEVSGSSQLAQGVGTLMQWEELFKSYRMTLQSGESY